MQNAIRFKDQNLSITHFYNEVLIECVVCSKMAKCSVSNETNVAKLICLNCGLNKTKNTQIDTYIRVIMPAHSYFNATLWLQYSFKKSLFWAYNYEHLNYLEAYIQSTLREHDERQGFTLLEKLPKFIHKGTNREGLLKIIKKLKSK